jgi:DNA-binding transcriptional ArsR family regulator
MTSHTPIVPNGRSRLAVAPGLTGDLRVTYSPDVDEVFKALADPTRRRLLDRLFERDGQTLSALEGELPMSRFGVMKHLKVLEAAGLVTTRRRGREKLHFLNPVPIRLVHDRWVSKYAQPWASALSELKKEIENSNEEDER